MDKSKNFNSDPLKIKNNDSLELATNCSLCYFKYDAEFHYPLVLACGHNICNNSVDKLYQLNKIECPFCKQTSNYKKREQIPRNYALIEIIQELDKPSLQIQFEDEFSMLNPIKKLIEEIKSENNKIGDLLERITQQLNSIKEYNTHLIQILEIFVAKTHVERKQIIREHFNKIKNFNELEMQQEKCRTIFKELKEKIKNVETTSLLISYKESLKQIQNTEKEYKQFINYSKLKEKNPLFKDEIIQDYLILCGNVKENFRKLLNAPRNFSIKKQKNLNIILDILKYQASLNQSNALNTLGFLYLKGVEVHNSKSIGFSYFKKSAQIQNDDPDPFFACYKLCDVINEKYDFLGNVILHNHPKTLGTLAYLIGAGNFENQQIRDKVTAFLYKASANKGNPVSLSNYGLRLEEGKGVSQNFDQAAEHYYKAIKTGDLEARRWLDSIIPKTARFQEKHPEYKILENGQYEEFCNQEIILL